MFCIANALGSENIEFYSEGGKKEAERGVLCGQSRKRPLKGRRIRQKDARQCLDACPQVVS